MAVFAAAGAGSQNLSPRFFLVIVRSPLEVVTGILRPPSAKRKQGILLARYAAARCNVTERGRFSHSGRRRPPGGSGWRCCF